MIMDSASNTLSFAFLDGKIIEHNMEMEIVLNIKMMMHMVV